MKYDPKKFDGANRPDETPASFAPEDWNEAIANGGYWSELLGYFVPVRDTDKREALIKRAMDQHQLTRRQAIEALNEAGF
jgi:hypothetical protein